MKVDKVLGVDIGGSHITVGVISLNDMSIVDGSLVRRKVNCHGTAAEILSSWKEAINSSMATSSEAIAQIGFAMPGPFDYENGVSLIKGFDKYEALYEMDIRKILSAMLQLKPENILFRNDAEAFLDGELFGGAAKGFAHAIGITLGTGLGSATSHDGITVDAERSVMDYQGEMIEEFVSTRGLLRTYFKLTGSKVDDAKALAQKYQDDTKAKKAFDIFGEQLMWFLHQFIEHEQPQVLVVGGNIAESWNLFMPNVINGLQASIVNMPLVVKAGNAEHAALIGAVCPFVQKENEVSLTF